MSGVNVTRAVGVGTAVASAGGGGACGKLEEGTPEEGTPENETGGGGSWPVGGDGGEADPGCDEDGNADGGG